MLALHRGLPVRNTSRRYEAFGADYSADMLQDAQRLGLDSGIPAHHYVRASFADLAEVTAWRSTMDAVTVNYAIYTQPEENSDYDTYLRMSLHGLASTLKPGGALAINLRDWDALKRAHTVGVAHAHSNTHGAQTFHCQYQWRFGTGRRHRSTLSMWDDNGASKVTDIWFAERSTTEIGIALAGAGLTVVDQGHHGWGVNAFYTLIARKEPLCD